MALLFADGFDHYGLDETNLLDGVYASSEETALSTTQAATGTTSIYIFNEDSNEEITNLRKVLPVAKDKLGVMGRFYFAELTVNYAG
jgi:hypothetical protein